jgi:uncharacterized membrane protein (UPF0127 family)
VPVRQVELNNLTRPTAPIQAGVCETFLTRLRGMMFARPVQPGSGLLFYQERASRVDSAIHMFFVNFDLAVVWLDDDWRVVDACLARRWRPFYMPARPARYFLETHPTHLKDFTVGDIIRVR